MKKNGKFAIIIYKEVKTWTKVYLFVRRKTKEMGNG
jgi:hypothetical protein